MRSVSWQAEKRTVLATSSKAASRSSGSYNRRASSIWSRSSSRIALRSLVRADRSFHEYRPLRGRTDLRRVSSGCDRECQFVDGDRDAAGPLLDLIGSRRNASRRSRFRRSDWSPPSAPLAPVAGFSSSPQPDHDQARQRTAQPAQRGRARSSARLLGAAAGQAGARQRRGPRAAAGNRTLGQRAAFGLGGGGLLGLFEDLVFALAVEQGEELIGSRSSPGGPGSSRCGRAARGALRECGGPSGEPARRGGAARRRSRRRSRRCSRARS